MHLRLLLPVLLGSFVVASQRREAALAGRQGGYGGYGGYGGGGNSGKGGGDDSGADDNGGTSQGSATGTAAASTASSVTLVGAVGATSGDKVCGTHMCVTATKNSTSVEYVLSSNDAASSTGWMAIGFGAQMAGTEMVIMWANSDGTVTVSQRKASGESEPSVDSNPTRIATLDPSFSVTSGNPSFAFTVPADGTGSQSIIYAFGNVNPSSSAKDANLQQHIENIAAQINLNKALASDGAPESSGGSTLPPLTYQQKLIIAHGVICVIGFMLLLPIGIFLARYWRTFSPMWFKGHWIAQFGLAGPVILTGIFLGIGAVSYGGAAHAADTHMKTGLALLVLYIVQCSLGGIIHFIKPKNSMRRPPQNYFHAILGLAIMGLALFQVHSGYDDEWPRITGRGNLPSSVKIIWIIWVIALPALYAVGLSMLPRQFRQESENRARAMNKYNISRPQASSEYHRMDQIDDNDHHHHQYRRQ